MNPFDFIGEQCVIGNSPERIEEDHLARYRFVKKFISDKLVLDVACGTGYGSAILSSGGAKKIVGIDISDRCIKYAHENFFKKNIIFKLGNATNLVFNDKYFDVIVSFETLEHIKDYRKFLSEVKRVLRDDGILIISTPNKIITSPYTQNPQNRFHFKEFTKRELTQVLSEYFQIQEWFGQRLIRKIFTRKIVRKTIRGVEIITKRNFGIYTIANGSDVVRLRDTNRIPRYFLVVCKKVNIANNILDKEMIWDI